MGCLGTGSFILAPQTSKEQPNHRHLDQCFACLDLALIILAHSPIARDPTQCSFHYPSPGQDAEATRAWLPFDHFKVPTTLGLAPGGQFLASVRSIGPDLFQTREHWGKPDKQTPSPFSIVQISGTQLKRISSMDETLYDDKLSGDITKERYEEKHGQFMKQQADIENQLTNVDASMGERLEQHLVILELSQKAADLYAKKTPEQKHLIISKLFENLTLKGGVVSVKYSKFAEAIVDNVQKTRNLMEA
jgi:hypothetical protein